MFSKCSEIIILSFLESHSLMKNFASKIYWFLILLDKHQWDVKFQSFFFDNPSGLKFSPLSVGSQGVGLECFASWPVSCRWHYRDIKVPKPSLTRSTQILFFPTQQIELFPIHWDWLLLVHPRWLHLKKKMEKKMIICVLSRLQQYQTAQLIDEIIFF